MEPLLRAGVVGAIVLGLLLPGEIHAAVALLVVPSVLLLGSIALLLPGARTPPDRAIAAALLAAACLLSIVASDNRDDWRRAAPLLAAGILAHAMGGRLGSATTRGRALAALALPVLLAGGLALSQKLVGFEELRHEIGALPGLSSEEKALYEARLDLGRPFGQFALPGLLGGFASGAMLLFAMESRSLTGSKRVAATGAAAAAAVAFLLSMSLGSALAVTASLATLVAVRRLPRRAAVALLVLGAVVLAALIAFRGGPLERRGSLRLRLANWDAARRLTIEEPLTGVGFGAFADAYARVVARDANRTKHAHSFLARASAETGVAGGAAVLFLIAIVLRDAAAGIATARDGAGWSLAAICMILHALVDVDMDVESLALFTPFVAGVSGAASRPAPASPGRAPAWIAACLGLLAVAPYVQSAEGRARVADAADLAREGRHEEAQEALRDALREDPASSVAHLLLGRELAAAGRHVEAISQLEAARALTPQRGVVRAPLALSYAAVGRRQDACHEMDEARRLLPQDDAVATLSERLCRARAPSPPPRTSPVAP